MSALPGRWRVLVAVCLVAAGLGACDFGGEKSPLASAALETIPVGGARRVADLSDASADTICVLYPYHDTVPPEEAASERINAALARDRFRAEEGHWTVVFTSGDDVARATFKRSAGLDVLVMDHADPAVANMLPATFAPALCAPGKDAAFAKVTWRERTYVIFGTLK